MTKHKHSEMIKAKADNMELVVFHNAKEPNEWTENVERLIPGFREDWDYFLSLPQHKEACLHWLNGGEAQTRFGDSWEARAVPKRDLGDWFAGVIWMKGQPIRIKPKKETRWIAYRSNKTLGEWSFDSESEARIYYAHGVDDPQFIEIEVEV